MDGPGGAARGQVAAILCGAHYRAPQLRCPGTWLADSAVDIVLGMTAVTSNDQRPHVFSLTPWPHIDRADRKHRNADHRQAAYFVTMLSTHLRRIDRRIARCHVAIASAEVAGDVENIHGFRGLLEEEQQEREAVEVWLGNLRRRFCSSGGGERP